MMITMTAMTALRVRRRLHAISTHVAHGLHMGCTCATRGLRMGATQLYIWSTHMLHTSYALVVVTMMTMVMAIVRTMVAMRSQRYR